MRCDGMVLRVEWKEGGKLARKAKKKIANWDVEQVGKHRREADDELVNVLDDYW